MISFVVVELNVIWINDHKDIKLFCQYLIDVFLEACCYVKKVKRHHLILKMTVSSSKSRLPLVSFANSHPIVSTSQIELGELINST